MHGGNSEVLQGAGSGKGVRVVVGLRALGKGQLWLQPRPAWCCGGRRAEGGGVAREQAQGTTQEHPSPPGTSVAVSHHRVRLPLAHAGPLPPWRPEWHLPPVPPAGGRACPVHEAAVPGQLMSWKSRRSSCRPQRDERHWGRVWQPQGVLRESWTRRCPEPRPRLRRKGRASHLGCWAHICLDLHVSCHWKQQQLSPSPCRVTQRRSQAMDRPGVPATRPSAAHGAASGPVQQKHLSVRARALCSAGLGGSWPSLLLRLRKLLGWGGPPEPGTPSGPPNPSCSALALPTTPLALAFSSRFIP